MDGLGKQLSVKNEQRKEVVTEKMLSMSDYPSRHDYTESCKGLRDRGKDQVKTNYGHKVKSDGYGDSWLGGEMRRERSLGTNEKQ